MNAVIASPRPRMFWVVAVAALLWNVLGVAMFCLQLGMSPEQIAAMPEPQRQVYEATPPWLNIVFAIAVFTGVLGAVGLLFKRRWATLLFLVSLIAVLVQMLCAYLLTPAWAASGAAGLAMSVLVVVIAAWLWWYSRRAAARGWIT